MKSLLTLTRLSLPVVLAVFTFAPLSAHAKGGHGGHSGGHSHSMSSRSSGSHRSSGMRTNHKQNHKLGGSHNGQVAGKQKTFKKSTGQNTRKKTNSLTNFKKKNGNKGLAQLGNKSGPKINKLKPIGNLTGKGKPGAGKLAQGKMGKGQQKHHPRHGDHWRWGWNGGTCDGGSCDGDGVDGDGELATSELASADPDASAARPDLELLGVTLLEEANEQELVGPRYRVAVRNSSETPVSQEFAVTLLAGNSDQLSPELPQNSKWVPGLAAGEAINVDVRLPFEVTQMNVQPNGEAGAFSHLFVLVDSNNDVDESDKTNNSGVSSDGSADPTSDLASR